jgi:uncharacterized membrane protein YebE (DUF533 family)
MFDANKIFAALQNELPRALSAFKTEGQGTIDRIKSDEGAKNAALGAGAAGVLGGLLLSGVGGKFGRQVATLGGLAALGTLAYNAYQKHQGGMPANSAPDGPFLPVTTEAKETIGKASIRAMIMAMKADGHIESGENAKLFDRLGQVNLSDEEKAFLFEEMARPLDVNSVVADATTPELAASLYAASLVAINLDGAPEKAYLAELATRLKLDAGLVSTLHTEAMATA